MTKKHYYLLSSLVAAAFVAEPAIGQVVNLSDGNSTAGVNLTSPTGMFSWTINGVTQLMQQWYWYSIPGVTAGPKSIDSLGAPVYTSSGNAIDAEYNDPNGQFSIEVTYQLSGGAPGGNNWNSDISETATIYNNTGNPLNISFYQYSDFALAGSQGNEIANINQSGSGYSQATVTKGVNQVSETISEPMANEGETALGNTILNGLNSGSPFVLNNNLSAGPSATQDAVWALEFDCSIAGGSSQYVLSDNDLNVGPVPEPSVLALLPLGGLAMLVVRRRRSR